MKITSIKSHVLRYELDAELGYSQQYYKHRTAHLVEVQTDEGITGWGECFGPGNIALANKYIVEKVIQPLIVGEDPLNKEYIWHKVYNLLRDSGQKGMPIQALSGIDIALWDILGKKTKTPLYQLVGGKCNDQIPVYGYGMMLQKKSVDELVELFKEEAKQIKSKNFKAMKMKIGLGPKEDLKLVQAVRVAIGKDFKLMVDANHAYNVNDALYVGRGLDELDIFWFEEPVAPENYDGYKELRQKINTNIAGGEAEFTKYGWNELIKNKCIDIAQPEVCGLGGITEYLKVLAIAQANFIPVINHVWGSAVSIAVNLHLLTAQPDMPGGLFPSKSMLEFDTTEKNIFITDLPKEDFSILGQVKQNNGFASITDNPGIGITPNEDFIKEFEVNE
ncbi:mandelate racemase/muconate lactonizing enzyme family protein [Candidatus Pelagibacter sp.]|nr:mandelate racemase/muconate lactonizing enzyme family protein [Candidatus Pelagibacter sp.]